MSCLLCFRWVAADTKTYFSFSLVIIYFTSPTPIWRFAPYKKNTQHTYFCCFRRKVYAYYISLFLVGAEIKTSKYILTFVFSKHTLTLFWT